MGTSYIAHNGSGFWARDARLAFWLYLLCQEIDGCPEKSHWLQTIRDHWQLQASEAFTGCMSAMLDEHVGTALARLQTAIALSEGARAQLLAFGPTIPKDTLNALPFHRHSRYLDGWNTNDMLRVADAWIELLRGQISWDASTSPVL